MTKTSLKSPTWAFRNVPAYAPHLANREPLADETTAYYWAVIPTVNSDGTGISSDPGRGEDSPQSFNKSSNTADTRVTCKRQHHRQPADLRVDVGRECSQLSTAGVPRPVVRESARGCHDRLHCLHELVYLSGRHGALLARARERLDRPRVELVDREHLRTHANPRPRPQPGNAHGGEAIPVLNWSPVQGAIGYDLHFEEVNGQPLNFSFPAAAATPLEWYGVGVWRWQVRAEFPAASPGADNTERLFPATGVRTNAERAERRRRGQDGRTARNLVEPGRGGQAVPGRALDHQRVREHNRIASCRQHELGTANQSAHAQNRGSLFWRVAAVDVGGNVGSFASGGIRAPGRPNACPRARPGRARKVDARPSA